MNTSDSLLSKRSARLGTGIGVVVGKRKYPHSKKNIWSRVLSWYYRQKKDEENLKHKLMASHSIMSEKKHDKIKI